MIKKSLSSWYSKKTVLVTGGTSGIGLDMARLLVGWGSLVVITGKDESRLAGALKELNLIQAQSAKAYRVDFANPQERQDVFRRILSENPVDILINNAGFGYMGEFSAMPQESISAMESVNISSLAELCRLCVVSMKEQRWGGILNVGSVASFFPTPDSAFYCGTKYFVRGFTDALHAELESFGIHVTGLYPGKTLTRFLTRATSGKSEQWQQAMASKDVALAGLMGLARNRLHVIPGFMNQLMVAAATDLPPQVLLSLSRKRLSSEIN